VDVFVFKPTTASQLLVDLKIQQNCLEAESLRENSEELCSPIKTANKGRQRFLKM
jgi:hypothetical protein